jgi:hypothetical protein
MKRQKEIIIILASIFVLSMIWIGFNLWHNAVTSTISQPLNADIQDISPDFNTNSIQILKKRTYIDPLYSVSGQKDETSTTEATPLATAAAVPTVPLQASTSGQTASGSSLKL